MNILEIFEFYSQCVQATREVVRFTQKVSHPDKSPHHEAELEVAYCDFKLAASPKFKQNANSPGIKDGMWASLKELT